MIKIPNLSEFMQFRVYMSRISFKRVKFSLLKFNNKQLN